MPMLNFKPQFVEPIRTRRKRHTIRAKRKIPIKVGDKLYLYCGARHPGCFRILPEPTVCTMTLPILIAIAIADRVEVDGQVLGPDEMDTLAVADGFEDWTAMRNFWRQEHGKTRRAGADGWITRCVDFEGDIIHWRE